MQELLDRLIRILDKGLLEETGIGKVFLKLALYDLFNRLRGFSFSLRHGYVFLLLDKIRRNLVARNANRRSSGNMHAHIFG